MSLNVLNTVVLILGLKVGNPLNSLYFISTVLRHSGLNFSDRDPVLYISNNGILFKKFKLLLVNAIVVDTLWLIARLMESTYVSLGEHPLHSGSYI